MWSILASLHKFINNPKRVEKYYPFRIELNFSGIEFPMQTKNIKKFEELNPHISVNVYMFDETKKRVYPIRLTKAVKAHHIHLLLIIEKPTIDSENFSGVVTRKMHYV